MSSTVASPVRHPIERFSRCDERTDRRGGPLAHRNAGVHMTAARRRVPIRWKRGASAEWRRYSNGEVQRPELPAPPRGIVDGSRRPGRSPEHRPIGLVEQHPGDREIDGRVAGGEVAEVDHGRDRAVPDDHVRRVQVTVHPQRRPVPLRHLRQFLQPGPHRAGLRSRGRVRNEPSPAGRGWLDARDELGDRPAAAELVVRRVRRRRPVQRGDELAQTLRVAATGRRDPTSAATSPSKNGHTLQSHGNPQPGTPVRTGAGIGIGSVRASSGSQRCSCSTRSAPSCRRGSRTTSSSPRRKIALSHPKASGVSGNRRGRGAARRAATGRDRR